MDCNRDRSCLQYAKYNGVQLLRAKVLFTGWVEVKSSKKPGRYWQRCLKCGGTINDWTQGAERQ